MINLLPLQEKKELEKREKLKLTLILGIIFIIFLVYLFLILLSIKIYISSELGTQRIIYDIEEKKFNTSEVQEFQQRIIKANQNLAELDSFYHGQIDLTDILEKISALLPPGVSLKNLTWQKETSQVSLSGFAPLRENLFELRNNLEKDFEEVYFPPSNWLKPKDIDFRATFKIRSTK